MQRQVDPGTHREVAVGQHQPNNHQGCQPLVEVDHMAYLHGWGAGDDRLEGPDGCSLSVPLEHGHKSATRELGAPSS